MYCIKDIDAQVVIAGKDHDAQQRVVDRLLAAGKQVVIPSIGARRIQRQYGHSRHNPHKANQALGGEFLCSP